jgi:rhodanese-related sulfurtransferase
MYKGDILPKEAFSRLQADPQAVLLDVRTGPEWAFVGSPAVERLLRISWQVFPSMEVNPRFAAAVEEAGVPKSAQIFCICRSGSRSAQAASALAAAGFTSCYNVAEGFEGARDSEGHRGTVGGWKVAGLPWVQS